MHIISQHFLAFIIKYRFRITIYLFIHFTSTSIFVFISLFIKLYCVCVLFSQRFPLLFIFIFSFITLLVISLKHGRLKSPLRFKKFLRSMGLRGSDTLHAFFRFYFFTYHFCPFSSYMIDCFLSSLFLNCRSLF